MNITARTARKSAIPIVKIKFKDKINLLLKQKHLQLMVLPGIIWMFIFNYIPMTGIVIAFKNFKITKPISEAPG